MCEREKKTHKKNFLVLIQCSKHLSWLHITTLRSDWVALVGDDDEDDDDGGEHSVHIIFSMSFITLYWIQWVSLYWQMHSIKSRSIRMVSIQCFLALFRYRMLKIEYLLWAKYIPTYKFSRNNFYVTMTHTHIHPYGIEIWFIGIEIWDHVPFFLQILYNGTDTDNIVIKAISSSKAKISLFPTITPLLRSPSSHPPSEIQWIEFKFFFPSTPYNSTF